jgi:hypothetical protein
MDDPVKRVAAFIEHLLYGDDGSTYRATHVHTYGDLRGFQSHVPAVLREAFAREDFDEMDWTMIVNDLMED